MGLCVFTVCLVLDSDHLTENQLDERAKRKESRKETCEMIFESIRLSIMAVLFFLTVTSPDIAMFTINLQNECTLGTEDGVSQYVNFSLSTWMYWASITHLSLFSLGFFVNGVLFLNCQRVCCWDCEQWFKQCIALMIAGIALMTWIFLFAWTVIGFLLEEEIGKYGVNNEQCMHVSKAWCVIDIVFRVCLCCAIFGD